MITPLDSKAPEPPRYRPLLTVVLTVAIGIAFSRLAPAMPAPLWWTIALCGVLGWALWRNRHERFALLALLAGVAATAATWHDLRWSKFDIDEIGRFAREQPLPACVTAVALESPIRVPAPPFDPLRAMPGGETSRLHVQIHSIRDGQVWRRAVGQAVVFVDGHLLGIRAGDRLQILGQLSAPAPASNPGEFDAALDARAQRKLARIGCNYPHAVTRLDIASASPLWHPIAHLRRYADNLLWKHISAERAGLASALLFGQRGRLSQGDRDAFVRTGTFDLLAISGLHVGILATGLFVVLRFGWISRGASLATVATVIVFYALLTGAQPPVVRATIMVLIVCGGLAWGRRPLALNTLAAAALVVLVLNPSDLFRIGPQLSFAAVAMLIAVGPAIARWPQLDPLSTLIMRTRPRPWRFLRDAGLWAVRSLALSLAVAIAVMPLVATQFHLVSFVGIPLHPLLWIPMCVALLSGFGMFLVGWLLPPVAALLGQLCDTCLWIMHATVQWAENLPAGHVWVSGPTPTWTAGLYLLVLALLMARRWQFPRRWTAALLCGWITLGLTWPAHPQNQPSLCCTFLDVGHGTAVVIELPDGATLLYDVGQLGWPAGATRTVSGYLWSRGIRHLDGIILSHADVDHCNGLPALLERFSVGSVLMTPLTAQHEGEAVRLVRSAVHNAHVSLQQVRQGDRLRVDPRVELSLLHPPAHGVPGSSNANSIVLLIEYAGRRILLPGDLETPGLESLLRQPPLPCDVVMAPHHGSALSDPPSFAAWSRPQSVIVSGGHGPDQPATGAAYRAVGASLLHTSQHGAVQVQIDSVGVLTVRTYRGDRF